MFKKDSIVGNVLSNKSVIVCRVVGFIDAGDGTTMYRLTDAREVRDDAWLIENNRTWAAPEENVRPHDADCDVCHKDGLVIFKG